MWVVIFSTSIFLKHFSFWEEMSAIWSKMYIGIFVKSPLFVSDFNYIWNSTRYFRKSTQISNFMKIRLVEAELFHADRRTGMTIIIEGFRNFANAPKKGGGLCGFEPHADSSPLTLNRLTWNIWWAPNNASRWQMGFNSAFKVLKS